MLSLRPFLGAAACAGMLATCGGPGGATSPSPSAADGTSAPSSASTSPGKGFTGSGFTTVVPSGWSDKSNVATEVAKYSGGGQVLFLAEQPPRAGTFQTNVNDVAANINVIALSTAVPDDQVAAYLSSVTTHGATNLSSPQSFTIDGTAGQYIRYDQDISGSTGVTPGESQDMVINHGRVSYDIVFNTSQYAFAQQLPAIEAVLAAWRWTS